MTQKEQILEHLLEHNHITSMEAISRYGITRLSEYIHQLRKDGYHIETETRVGAKRYKQTPHYALYVLMED